MLLDRVSNPGPLTYESGALLIALRGPARMLCTVTCTNYITVLNCHHRNAFFNRPVIDTEDELLYRAIKTICRMLLYLQKTLLWYNN